MLVKVTNPNYNKITGSQKTFQAQKLSSQLTHPGPFVVHQIGTDLDNECTVNHLPVRNTECCHHPVLQK